MTQYPLSCSLHTTTVYLKKGLMSPVSEIICTPKKLHYPRHTEPNSLLGDFGNFDFNLPSGWFLCSLKFDSHWPNG